MITIICLFVELQINDNYTLFADQKQDKMKPTIDAQFLWYQPHLDKP